MTSQCTDNRPMALVAIADGTGGVRHELRPVMQSRQSAKARSRPAPDPIRANPDSSAQQLKQIIERLENLEEEKRGIADDIRDVKAEAKATGFDVAAISAIMKLRALHPDNRMEAEAVLDSYKLALGLE